jgi:hypothetical protein
VYIEVVMKGFAYKVETTRLDYAATKWCYENFGPRWSALDNHDGIWMCFWAGHITGGYNWHFKHEKDAMMFILRWK